jgi:hypothetical protein
VSSATSAPASMTFPSISFPSNTAPTQSNNDITVSNGVTLTAKQTGGGAAASSSSSPGAAAPTALTGMLVGGAVGMAAVGVAALL